MSTHNICFCGEISIQYVRKSAEIFCFFSILYYGNGMAYIGLDKS